MCLLTNQREEKTASKDFIVWKFLIKKSFFKKPTSPYYQNFKWRRFKLEKSELYHEPTAEGLIENELTTNNRYKYRVMHGLHAFKNKDKAVQCIALILGKHVIRKFVIPKGSKYFENEHEIASNQMKML